MSEQCKAHDPSTCRFHGSKKALDQLQAQKNLATANGDLSAQFEAQQQIDSLTKSGNKESFFKRAVDDDSLRDAQLDNKNSAEAIRQAEKEAEDFYLPIEDENRVMTRFNELYFICNLMRTKGAPVEPVTARLAATTLFTEEEQAILIRAAAHCKSNCEESDHNEVYNVLKWINLIGRLNTSITRSGYYDAKVLDAANLLRKIEVKQEAVTPTVEAPMAAVETVEAPKVSGFKAFMNRFKG